MPEKKKMGRPTDSPKTHEIKTRVDDATFQVLEDYCSRANRNRSEAIRDGVLLLKDTCPKK